MTIKMRQFSRLNLSGRLVISYSLVSLITALLISASLYQVLSNRMFNDLKQRLTYVVSLTADQINGDSLATLQSPEDVHSAAYTQISAQLLHIPELIPEISYVYLVRATDDGKVAFIVDDDGVDPTPIGTEYSDLGEVLAENITTLKSAITEKKTYTDEWGTWLSGYAPVFTSSGNLTGVVGADISSASIAKQQRSLVLICLGIFALSLPVAFFFGVNTTRYVARPIKLLKTLADQIVFHDLAEFSASISRIAHGDFRESAISFRAEPIAISNQDEIGELGAAFNQMIAVMKNTEQEFSAMGENLRALYGNVGEGVSKVGAASGQLSRISQENRSATGTISSSMENLSSSFSKEKILVNQASAAVGQLDRAILDVSSGTDEQAQAVVAAFEQSTQISAILQQVVNSVEKSDEVNQHAYQDGQQGVATVQSAIENMKKINAWVAQTVAQMKQMGEATAKISKMVEAIEEIASQTNLLSLNAAIEAARAGESGRGFAVVAEEVRKLAEKSAGSAREITTLVATVQGTVQTAVASMQNGAREVEIGVDLVNASGQTIDGILTSIQSIQNETCHVLQECQQAETINQRLSASMGSVREIAERNMQATKQMTASSTEMNRSLTHFITVSNDTLTASDQVLEPLKQVNRRSAELLDSAESLDAMARTLQAALENIKL